MIRQSRLLVIAACLAITGLCQSQAIFKRTASQPVPKQARSVASDAQALRQEFHKLLDRPLVPLTPEVIDTQARGTNIVVEHGRFRSEKGEWVPYLLYLPLDHGPRVPAAIVLHGTGGSKDGVRGTLIALASYGIAAIGIDARFHGERITGGAHGSTEYEQAIIKAFRADAKNQDHPFYYDTVYDLWRTLDFLQSRKEIDPKRLGIMGYSMGGIETWLAAATDARLQVAVPIISVQSFKWSLENDQWHGRAVTIHEAHKLAAKDLGEKDVNERVCRELWSKVIPGILDRFDCPNMLAAIAPRPLYIVNGELDPNCPVTGARIAVTTAQLAYKGFGAEDKLKVTIASGVKHAVTEEMQKDALAWMTDHLHAAARPVNTAVKR